MGYSKVIFAGDELEVWKYENDCFNVGRKKSAVADELYSGDLDDSGEDSLPEKPVREKKARRPDNARRAKMVFRRLVHAQLGGTDHPALLLLTYRRNETDLGVGYKDFTNFIVALRRAYGLDFKYIAVPEFQKRGAIHFHVLIWGLPRELVGSERSTRVVSKIWGLGFIYFKETDGSGKLSNYLAKYMSKAFLEPRLGGKKAYVASRNVIRPFVAGRNGELGELLDDLGVIHMVPLRDARYGTQWLGRAHYQKFIATPPYGNEGNGIGGSG